MKSKFEIVAEKMGAGIYAKFLDVACSKWEILDELSQSHFLGQISVESENFTDLTEDLNYRPSRLLAVFPGRNGLRTIEQAAIICSRGYSGIAEAVYGPPWGAKALGNINPGDGARFPGRGLKQITGRRNVTEYSRVMYGDDRVVKNPNLLLEPFDAAMSAAWFFRASKAYNAALADNVELVTKRINGGQMALTARKLATAQAKREFAKLRATR